MRIEIQFDGSDMSENEDTVVTMVSTTICLMADVLDDSPSMPSDGVIAGLAREIAVFLMELGKLGAFSGMDGDTRPGSFEELVDTTMDRTRENLNRAVGQYYTLYLQGESPRTQETDWNAVFEHIVKDTDQEPPPTGS